MNIPLYKPFLPEEIQSFASGPMDSGWLGYGSQAKKLEDLFTNRFGGWALAVTSCTAALYLAARCIKKTDLDEVIIPSITFVSTGMAFKSAGYKVVSVDVDEQGMLSPDSVKEAITYHTRAVIAVHLYGQRVPLDRIRSICDENGVMLVEDCAHRGGLDDRAHLGDICCFSFNVMKELPSGEGGMLWGKNMELEKYAREFANVGLIENTVQRTSALKHSNYLFGMQSGLKFLQNDIIASLTLRLMSLDSDNRQRRREIFAWYDDILRRYEEFSVFTRRQDDSYLMYVVRLNEKYVDSFRSYLAQNGIATSHHYPSLSEHPLFENRIACTQALQMEREIITLPCFAELSKEQFELIRKAITEFAEMNNFHRMDESKRKQL